MRNERISSPVAHFVLSQYIIKLKFKESQENVHYRDCNPHLGPRVKVVSHNKNAKSKILS